MVVVWAQPGWAGTSSIKEVNHLRNVTTVSTVRLIKEVNHSCSVTTVRLIKEVNHSCSIITVDSHLVCDTTICASVIVPMALYKYVYDYDYDYGNRVSTSVGNSGLCWTVFTRNRDTAVPAEGNGDIQKLICVLVARPRRCLALLNPVPWQNWMAAYLGYTLRMKMLFRGWPVMAHETHTRRRLLSGWSKK